MTQITAKNAKFIHLGRYKHKRVVRKACLDDGIITINFPEVEHVDGQIPSVADIQNEYPEHLWGLHTRQIRTFYSAHEFGASEEDTIWFTRVDSFVSYDERKLYWCKARKEVKKLQPDVRYDEQMVRWRKAFNFNRDGWSCQDVNGEVLHLSRIDKKLVEFRRRPTVNDVPDAEFDYLMDLINGKIL